MTKDQLLTEAQLLCDAIDEIINESMASHDMKQSQEHRKIRELQSQIAEQKLKVILKKGDELREYKNS